MCVMEEKKLCAFRCPAFKVYKTRSCLHSFSRSYLFLSFAYIDSSCWVTERDLKWTQNIYIYINFSRKYIYSSRINQHNAAKNWYDVYIYECVCLSFGSKLRSEVKMKSNRLIFILVRRTALCGL